ncbi:hypothetical protein CsSME_00007154 [Camellia sinensis var. sinensis]|uniref:SUMO-activating enzyme subunit 1B-2 n=1 Tax=Camellia lanceoleosa TaxID=1840588 RepID=A0ACC0HVQ2_9ERIC|nr:SUMO-activating enzyme subunit 1B-1-like [Camellia sinensis]XP_028112360.1 SUMO-activating enzyme subunit 1B-1-like [Camellia sinensis]XP_028112423.1 SUMO-activating enzyme subunit 1B-1-like [Camellia sinensis]KAI8017236.1 SUMO-activating enzyme subunit 1B-2 [Camellia lanceoleosa]
MDGEELTEQETALYDRQIRVWGADAQRRLSKAHILVSGLKGTVVEFCKNIVLAGVGSLTLIDDRPVTKEALSANFLIDPDDNEFTGKSLAELCCDSLKDFNPMVRVSVENGDLSSFGVDFYDKFDVVVVSCCSITAKRLINEKCRKLPKRVAFYTVDCRDSCGEIFVDLQNYTYSKKKLDETIECQLQYPSFEDAIAVPWKSLPRRMSKLYFAMRVIEQFEEAEGRDPGQTSKDDLPKVLKLRKELFEAQSLNESLIPDSLLERLVSCTTEFPPVCAVIGGILGQEVIKAISGKGDPLKNFFFFDAMDGKGIIEDISKPDSGS